MVAAVERGPRTVVPKSAGTPSFGTPLVLLAALLGSFAIVALVMVRNHSWTDSVMAMLPLPGPSASFAADPSLTTQLRVSDARAWNATLGDQTPALVADASVTNDALVPVRHIMLEAEARAHGRLVAVETVGCGKTVSNRLLRRIGRDEIGALREIDASSPVQPGASIPCQVAFAGVAAGVDEVVLRVASVEPLPGHGPAVFRPRE
jgi:hypothetical protein